MANRNDQIKALGKAFGLVEPHITGAAAIKERAQITPLSALTEAITRAIDSRSYPAAVERQVAGLLDTVNSDFVDRLSTADKNTWWAGYYSAQKN